MLEIWAAIKGAWLFVERFPMACNCISNPRSPGTHVVGSWVIGSTSLYREPRAGTQYI